VGLHGQAQSRDCDADTKYLSEAKGTGLKAAPTRRRCRASLELFPTFSSEQFSSADLECSQLNS